MTTKSKHIEGTQPLVPERAFIVQLSIDDRQPSATINGRAENVATGEQLRFSSAEELTDFLKAVTPSVPSD